MAHRPVQPPTCDRPGRGPPATERTELIMCATDAPGPATLVVIPTYDEREALPGTLARLRAALPHAHALVVDDSSPDGTGRWAQQEASRDDHVHVLHRAGKQGLGPAYLAGFSWGLERGYEVLVEMDADRSEEHTSELQSRGHLVCRL